MANHRAGHWHQACIAVSVVALALGGVPRAAGAADETQMIYIEFHPMSATVRSSSFGASVRKLWRSGDRYLRIEEAPDPEQRIHGVMIVNEPDTWLWNRFDNIARHIVDPGPSYIVHFPIFQGESSKDLNILEYGKERQFFVSKNAHSISDQKIDDTVCTVQSLQIDDSSLTLYLRKSDGRPIQVSISNPRHSYAMRFDKYETHLKFDPSLFTKPAGAKIVEEK